MTYADITTNDPSAIKRWVQERRFASALSLAELRGTVLDFGCGNGELCRRIGIRSDVTLICYEPSSRLYAEAADNLANINVTLTRNIDSVARSSVDIVFCLEVFEHLPEGELRKACRQIADLLRPDGFAVIGVPIEIGPPALLKGLFRMARRYGSHDATIRNVLLATIGEPPDRAVSMMEPGLAYFFPHLGFDHRKLAALLSEYFVIEKVLCSPFHWLRSWANSEMYFRLRRGLTT
jgi:SAM-dependent methyltransferase